MQNLLKVNLQKTAIDILFNNEKNVKRKSAFLKSTAVYKRDKLTLSNEAVQLQQISQEVKKSNNTSLDQKIGIQSYISKCISICRVSIE